jgi:hypothetical protein
MFSNNTLDCLEENYEQTIQGKSTEEGQNAHFNMGGLKPRVSQYVTSPFTGN